MKNNTNWSTAQFQSYLLIYGMNADFKQMPSELNYIKNKTDLTIFEEMQNEFNSDSDYARACKIRNAFKELKYTSEDAEQFVEELRSLFLVDDNFDVLEQNLLIGVKRLLSN